MGLDVNVYRLTKPCSEVELRDDTINPKSFWPTAHQLEAWRQHWPDIQAERTEMFDSEKLAKDFAIPESFILDSWDLSDPKGWAEYFDMDEKLPNRRIEVNSADYLGNHVEYEVAFIAQAVSHLRKPFKGAGSSTSQDGDTLTLLLRNFSDDIEEQLKTVLGEAAMMSSYALLRYEDLPRLQALKALCDEPEEWQQYVLDKMTDEFCVTVIDW
jgi:hypothetical protein